MKECFNIAFANVFHFIALLQLHILQQPTFSLTEIKILIALVRISIYSPVHCSFPQRLAFKPISFSLLCLT